MKKVTTIAILSVLVFACSRKTVSTTATPAATTPPATTVQAPAPDPALAALVESGKAVYTTRCGRCHELKPVEAYTTTQWDGILKSMIPKAKLDEKQSAEVTAYVKAYAKK